MTSSMQQAIRLLQLPSVELCQELDAMLQSCIFLEIDESDQFSDGYKNFSLAATHPSFTEDTSAVPETLDSYLRWQLNFLSLNSIESAIAEVLIDGINEKGYLKISLQDVITVLNIEALDISMVLAVLQKIQEFEPAGVAARTEQECLSIQLERKVLNKAVKLNALKLLETCYEDLADNSWATLQKKAGLSEIEIQLAMSAIQSLDPFPGWKIGDSSISYCIPDLLVTKHNDRWSVTLNKSVSPRVRISPYYKRVICSSDNYADNGHWRQQLKHAQCFVRGLNNRYSTLLQVMYALLAKQQDFFELGEPAMKVLSMRSVAKDLGLHESTVSRAVRGKYVQTPRGLLPMNYFFSADVCSQGVSAVALQAAIRKIIASENIHAPLSDANVQQALATMNINVARRTVTKHRRSLGFSSSRQRKGRKCGR